MMDFVIESKGHENGFLRKTISFENMNDFHLKKVGGFEYPKNF